MNMKNIFLAAALLTMATIPVFAGQCDTNMTGSDRRLHYKSYPACKNEADKGDASAQYWLGFMLAYDMTKRYTQGQHERDIPMAIEWLKKASDQGEVRAMYHLGGLYIGNLHDWQPGNSEIENEGLRLLEMASSKGHAGAMLSLQHFYEKRDPVMAYAWYLVRKQSGFTSGDTLLRDKLSDKQQQDAISLADAWMKSNNR